MNLRQARDRRERLRPIYAACRSDWIRTSRVVTSPVAQAPPRRRAWIAHVRSHKTTAQEVSSRQASLQPGDIIVSANGTNVANASVLDRLISVVRIGSTITLGVVRGDRRVEVRVPIVRLTRDGPIRN